MLEVINWMTDRMLNQYGVVPRYLTSLPHIFSAPLIHANIQHFLSNFLTLAIFSLLALQFGHMRYLKLTAFVVIVSGLCVWILGRSATHIGASGLIYGYFGFLLVAGFFSKKKRLALISFCVAIIYGGMVWGIVPMNVYVSWEYHLFGFIAGIWFALRSIKRT